jgi:hypothetical protein
MRLPPPRSRKRRIKRSGPSTNALEPTKTLNWC